MAAGQRIGIATRQRGAAIPFFIVPTVVSSLLCSLSRIYPRQI
jgi:hypothetical protein